MVPFTTLHGSVSVPVADHSNGLNPGNVANDVCLPTTADNEVVISKEAHNLLQRTPRSKLVMEKLSWGMHAGSKVYAVQFKGFPGLVALPEGTMRDYFVDELLVYHEKVVAPSRLE